MSGGARHCTGCGRPLEHAPPVVCPACGTAHWSNPKPCGGGVLAHEDRILLLRRAIDPFFGCWDIPGGFCEGGEHPRAAAERELLEEVGVRARATQLLGVWIDSYGPPTADGEQPTTLNLYYVLEPPPGLVAPQLDRSENSELGWFGPDETPEPLAFPGHIPLVLDAWRRLARGERLEPGLERQGRPCRCRYEKR